jgi:hypothetical protein
MTRRLYETRYNNTLSTFLTGCNSSAERDMAACRERMIQALPGQHAQNDLDDYQKACMQVAGYHFSAMVSSCSEGDAYQSGACYVRWSSN